MNALPASPPPELIRECTRFSHHQPHPALLGLRERLQETYGDALLGILYYGSCLRGGDPFDGLVDLYVIVDSYHHAFGKWAATFFNQLLPPNVFYLEVPLTGGTVRCKYAVLSMHHLEKCVSPQWFHSYFWARFAQPMGLLHALDDEIAQRIHGLQAQAVLTFIGRVLPRLPETFTSADVWTQGLRLTYRAELRAEGGRRADEIYRLYAPYYQAVTPPALAALPIVKAAGEAQHYSTHIPASQRYTARLFWGLRITQGKLLSILRLLKAFFTFEGGLDYIVWKLERHSGVSIEITPRLRRWPLIFIWGLMWRLYRRGVFR